VAALVAVVAGCGDDGPSRATFARQADAICKPALGQLREVRDRIGAAAAGADPDAIFTTSADLLREGAAISRRTFDRVETLDTPAGDRDAVGAWIADNRRQAAVTDELAAAFDAQDQTRIARLSERVDALEERNNEAARELGLRSCAERVQA
jgi:hypothetical protein